MRICFIYGGRDSTDGGVGFLRNLAQGLAERNHTCFAVVGQPRDCELLLSGRVQEETQIGGDWSWGWTPEQRSARSQMTTAVREMEPDVIHVIHPCGGFGRSGHIHALPVFWRGAPIVASFWGLNVGWRAGWRVRVAAAALLMQADLVTAHDPALKRLLSRWPRAGTVRLLPVGSQIVPSDATLRLSKDELRRRHGLCPSAYYISYFGGFDRGRGLTDLFRAVQILRRQGHSDIRLLMIGWQRHVPNSAFAATQALIARRGLSEVVEMTRFSPPQVVCELFRASDISVFPFRGNSVGRTSLMVALAVGMPTVLASDDTDLLQLETAVRKCARGNPTMLAEAIAELKGNRSAALILGRKAREVWLQDFCWERLVSKYLSVYEEISR